MSIVFFASGWLGPKQTFPSLRASFPDEWMVCADFERAGDNTPYAQLCAKGWPDLVIYMSVPEGAPNLPVINEFREIRKRSKLVMICPEGSDAAWRDLLVSYNAAGDLFDLIVNFDGNRAWPGSEKGLTRLCPIDPAPWGEPLEWASRDKELGFSGTLSGYRSNAIIPQPEVTVRCASASAGAEGGYPSHIAFMRSCRFTFNARNRPQEKENHVKARVVEAGLAGTCLIEPYGTPTADWFTPGEDFLTYEFFHEVAALQQNPRAQEIAESLHRRVLTEHSPRQFWTDIFARIS